MKRQISLRDTEFQAGDLLGGEKPKDLETEISLCSEVYICFCLLFFGGVGGSTVAEIYRLYSSKMF